MSTRTIQVDITFTYEENEAVSVERSAADLAHILRGDWESAGFHIEISACGEK